MGEKVYYLTEGAIFVIMALFAILNPNNMLPIEIIKKMRSQ